MDTSLNLIDLQYLTNPFEMNKLTRSKQIEIVSKTDLEFYKKRIFQLTKNMLRGEKTDTKVTKAFENYALTCIEHFKFVDKMEIIQKDYAGMKQPTGQNKKFNLDNTNNLIIKQNKPHRPKITDHIKVKSTRVVKPIVIPKKRHFNLKDPKFRDKGLKKKNINN